MLEWIDPVRVRADAPGPQPSLELPALEQAALGIATEQLARMGVGGAHLDPELSPLRDQVIADAVSQRTSECGNEVKTQSPAILTADAVGANRPAVAVEQTLGGCQVVRQRNVRVVKRGERARNRRLSQLRLVMEVRSEEH